MIEIFARRIVGNSLVGRFWVEITMIAIESRTPADILSQQLHRSRGGPPFRPGRGICPTREDDPQDRRERHRTEAERNTIPDPAHA
jgi:hypothetical protein